MEEKQMSLNEETKKTLPKPIEIDVRRLRMRDYNAINNAKESNFDTMAILIAIIGRISNYTEDELWDMELDEFNAVQSAFFEAIDNIVKKTNAGSSASS